MARLLGEVAMARSLGEVAMGRLLSDLAYLVRLLSPLPVSQSLLPRASTLGGGGRGGFTPTDPQILSSDTARYRRPPGTVTPLDLAGRDRRDRGNELSET